MHDYKITQNLVEEYKSKIDKIKDDVNYLKNYKQLSKNSMDQSNINLSRRPDINKAYVKKLELN